MKEQVGCVLPLQGSSSYICHDLKALILDPSQTLSDQCCPSIEQLPDLSTQLVQLCSIFCSDLLLYCNHLVCESDDLSQAPVHFGSTLDALNLKPQEVRVLIQGGVVVQVDCLKIQSSDGLIPNRFMMCMLQGQYSSSVGRFQPLLFLELCLEGREQGLESDLPSIFLRCAISNESSMVEITLTFSRTRVSPLSASAVCSGSTCLSMVVDDDDERKAVETDVKRSGRVFRMVSWLEEERERRWENSVSRREE